MTAYGNGIMTRQLYDNRTFLLKRTRTSPYIQTGWTFADNAGVKEDKIFSFDLMGNILQTHDKCTDCGLSATPDELTRNFAYDPLYRLLNATGRESNTQSSSVIWNNPPITQVPNAQNSRAYTQAFQYDKLGNIQKLQHIGNNNFTREFDYTNANNKLNNINVGLNTYNYLYDDTGNLIKENSNRHFEWDFGNNMRCFYNQASTAEPTVYAQYLYDSTGNRVKKIVRTQGGDYESVSYINGAFEYKTDGTDEQTTTHIMDDQSRIAMIRTGDDFGDSTPAIKYNLEDHLGSSSILLETNGTLINKEEYYPFGETSFGSYAKKRYRFSGKEKDLESGLYYYGARYYISWTCRFISIDPLASDYVHLTPYNYAGNKPINSIDIDGMQGENEEQTGGGKASEIPAQNTNAQGESIPWQDGDIWEDKATGIKYSTYNNEWGIALEEVTITPKSSKLNEVLSEMKSLVDKNIPYSQQGDRTSLSEKGLAALDCSETVSVYLKKLGIMDENKPSLGTGVMLNESSIQKATGSKDIEFVEGSKSSDFTPQRGDIFVWRTSGGGHTGIVYDVDGNNVTILEAIGNSGSGDERYNRENGGTATKGVSRTAVYRKSGGALSGHSGWVGYFRPIIK